MDILKQHVINQLVDEESLVVNVSVEVEAVSVLEKEEDHQVRFNLNLMTLCPLSSY